MHEIPRSIDLNADVGESFGAWTLGDDEGVLEAVTSANIACGFHAGDPLTMLETARAAVRRGVCIGAHVSYRDLAGFGRRFLDASGPELMADVIHQIGALQALAATAGGTVGYVKPHGALYNAIVTHEVHARAVVEAVRAVDPGLALLVLPGSCVERLAEAAGLRTVPEAFADRGYRADGTLVPRGEEGAVLHDPEEVARRMVRLTAEGRVRAIDGTDVEVRAESICVHGDTPGAVRMAEAVAEALRGAGIELRAFTDGVLPGDGSP